VRPNNPSEHGAAEGEALREWVVRERATRTIEIGLGYGISALFICEGDAPVSAERARLGGQRSPA
jgi:hypothetical protein